MNDEHNALYWLTVNIGNKIKAFVLRNKLSSLLTLSSLCWVCFVLRAYAHPYIIMSRVRTPEIISSVFAIAVLWKLVSNKRWKWSGVWLACVAVGLFLEFTMELPPHRYLTLYLRYRALQIGDIPSIPLTDHERIQPKHSIKVLAGEAMKEVEEVNTPDFVRIGNDFRWTMAVEPSYPFRKVFGHVTEVMNVSGLATSPNFSGENRVKVDFRVSEGMHMGRNSYVAVTRSLGLFRFWNYSPRDVRFLKDDRGEWVQVISLTRWSGFIFLWPEFGGVQVVHQQEHNTPLGTIRSWFVGDGEWIRPEDISKHRYLQGQNLVPYEVSRYIAQSFRFQNGFLSPLPGYHKGDIRIPDLPGDVNDQPFTTYFQFSTNAVVGPDDKLWHYFALEPYHDTKQALNTSVFVPADGVGEVKACRHFRINEALTGVSAIGPKVMESKKEYDWDQSRPAEHRPWVKYVGGQKRIFWLTTVVTYKEKGKTGPKDFIAGSTPGTTLTDALYKDVVWVNAHTPESWTNEVEKLLSPVWARAR